MIAIDLKVFLADRSNLVGLLLTPVVMTLIIGLVSGGVLGGAPEPPALEILDFDGSISSRQLVNLIGDANPALRLCPAPSVDLADQCPFQTAQFPDRQSALVRLAEAETAGILEIPAGMEQNLISGENVKLTLHTGAEIADTQTIQQAAEAALRRLAAAAKAADLSESLLELGGQHADPVLVSELKSQVYQSALQKWDGMSIDVRLSLSGPEDAAERAGSLQQGLSFSVPGMGSMFVMMTVLGGMGALIEDRRNWTLQRLGTMPVRRSTIIGAKIVSRLFLGMLQYLVVFLLGAVLGMNFGQDPLALVLVAFSFALAVTALSMALGTRLSSPAQASGVTLLLTLTLAPLGGAWWPLEITPPAMQAIGHLSPVAWAMDAFLALTYEGALLADIARPLLVLLAFSAAAFLIAIPRFQFDLD